MRQQQESKHHQSMATTTPTNQTLLLLQHPSHEHPLEPAELKGKGWRPQCFLCDKKILAEAYICKEGCAPFYSYHRACLEAPPQIDRHPLHPKHPLTLIHCRPSFRCHACREYVHLDGSSFRCDECEFDLDIGCAFSTLSDEGGSQGGKTSEQVTLPLHPHMLTSFSTRHDFVGGRTCYICRGGVLGDGYMCLRRRCEFVIHKRCIQDLSYADGTKAPRVYHGHPLATFVGEEDKCMTRCASCGSNESGEFIGCASCDVFYHRNCFQVPEILQYPSHNPRHTLVLFSKIGTAQQCQSCSSSLEDEIYYCCTSCEFFVHVGCAWQVLTYREEGMRAKTELSWHKHPLLLCHQTESISKDCFYCGDKSIGPTYVCEEKDCRFLLHKRCTEIESTITHPHHPDHPLTLCEGDDDHFYSCKACCRSNFGLRFSCERCLVDLDVKCAGRFPTHKHYLHEHKLIHVEEKLLYFRCNRCDTHKDLPLFHCVACDFNLHEECMGLPQVLESKIHWHPLTLHETFVEDNSGEYYCECCEDMRDPRLGVYVCGECELSMPRIYHVECALPELAKVYEKKRLPPAVVKLNKQIKDQREEVFKIKEEVRTIKEKLEGATRVLDELVNQRDILLRHTI